MKTQHIHYMLDNKTVCEKPSRLGYDFVTINTTAEDYESCPVCSSLLMAHNNKGHAQESLIPGVIYLPSQHTSRDMLNGIVLSSIFWFVVFMLCLLVFI